jgi:hypothetical protein
VNYQVIFNQIIEQEREKKSITLKKKKRGVEKTFQKRQRDYEIEMNRIEQELLSCTKSTFTPRKFP